MCTMEWNDLFEKEISKIRGDLLPKEFSGDARAMRVAREQVAKLIDDLGQESAISQGLNKVITSAEKMRNNDQTIYLLKDHRGLKGKGEMIGMLKIGRKHLFLFDDTPQHLVHEVEPLCILDFYIVRDRQRQGWGRILFEFMLQELDMQADMFAIDGPSVKMEKFLARNFNITKLLRQNNNFAVAPSFFDRSDEDISNGAREAFEEPAAAVGRFAAPKPASAIANVIHGEASAAEASRRYARSRRALNSH